MILAQKDATAQKDSSLTAIIFHAYLLKSAHVLMLENFTNPVPVELKAVKTALAQTARGVV